MLDRFNGDPDVENAMQEASDAVGSDLIGMSREGAPAGELDKTTNTQPALLALSVGVFRAWRRAGGEMPVVMGGHSLGEYSALVCSGAVDFGGAAKLVRLRARLMQDAVPEGVGAMCAVIGLDRAIVDEVCGEICRGGDGDVFSANYNAPGQTVISGHADAVSAAASALKERGARRTVTLPVSVPSHCSLMDSSVEPFIHALSEMDFSTPQVPVVQNATCAVEPDSEGIVQALARQLVSPVDWMAMVAEIARHADQFFECGPGNVLSGLHRRIMPGTSCVSLGSSEDLAAAVGGAPA